MRLGQEDIRWRFHARGVKVTPQRAAIYQALAERADHPTADDLYRHVRRQYPMISPNTVYYTLGVLREAGLLHEVNYWHDRSRFDANISLHHHLICLAFGIYLDNGQIGYPIAPYYLGRISIAVWEVDHYLVRALNDVEVGHDVTVWSYHYSSSSALVGEIEEQTPGERFYGNAGNCGLDLCHQVCDGR